MTLNQKRMKNIKPGEFYIDCSNRLCCCIKNDYTNDDLVGVPLGYDDFSGCSFSCCAPEYVNAWELPFLIMLSKKAPKLGLMSSRQMQYIINSSWEDKEWENYSKNLYCHWIYSAEVFIEIIYKKFSYFNKRKKRQYDPNAKKFLNLLYRYYDKLNEVYDMVLTKH